MTRALRVLILAHGYPPDLMGGTERSVHRLALALRADGCEVTVLAGSLDWSRGTMLERPKEGPKEGPDEEGIVVYRLHRDDSFFDHWHKSRLPAARRFVSEVLAEVQPDVMHVHHWLRSTRDLVATAARAGVPAVVTLHDFWTTCPLVFRVRPATGQFCESPMGPDPCLACAGSVPPHTPWVDAMAGRVRLAEHARDIARELELARARIVPSRSHGAAIERFSGREPGSLEFEVLPPGVEGRLVGRASVPSAPACTAEDPLVLAFWGHLSPVKGLELIPRALELLDDPSRVAVEVLGGDVDPAFAERLRGDCVGLPVRFHGAFEAADLSRHPALAGVHAMVSPSLAEESFGMVIDEALALGLPCLLSAVGAYAERGADQAWCALFERSSASALAECIQQLLDAPDRLAQLTAGVPADPFEGRTWEHHAAATRAIYERAILAGAPEIEPLAWFADRIQEQELADWERELRDADPTDLGLS